MESSQVESTGFGTTSAFIASQVGTTLGACFPKAPGNCCLGYKGKETVTLPSTLRTPEVRMQGNPLVRMQGDPMESKIHSWPPASTPAK